MDNQENNDKVDDFEKQMQEINEWQNNAYNPGYHIGSGKTPLPIKNGLKSPVIMLIIGVTSLIPVILNFKNGFSIDTIVFSLVPLILGIAFLYGGIIRLIRHKNR